MKGNILIVDDDVEVIKINAKYLTNEGYNVIYTNNPKKVMESLSKKGSEFFDFDSIDCVILDVMMPEIDGFTLCKAIRKCYNMPIIFLSGKVEEDDKLEGLLLGADDYVTKPYSIRELSARIMVNIRRRVKDEDKESILIYPPLKIDLLERKVYANNEEVFLSNREYEVLCFLASKPNEEVTFQEIGNRLWGAYEESDRQSVMVNVSRLRKKLGLYEGMENIIENIWSKGYKFVYRMK